MIIKPLKIGFLSVILLIFFYFTTLSAFESINYAFDQYRKFWLWLVPLAIGFGIQVGLYIHIKDFASNKVNRHRNMILKNGTTSAGTMVLCCLHHILDFLSILGLSAFAVVLIRYQSLFLSIGILFNINGIIKLLNDIEKNKIYSVGSVLAFIGKTNYKKIRYAIWVISLPLLLYQLNQI